MSALHPRVLCQLFLGAVVPALAGTSSAQCETWADDFVEHGFVGPANYLTSFDGELYAVVQVVTGYHGNWSPTVWRFDGQGWFPSKQFEWGGDRAMEFDDGAGPGLYWLETNFSGDPEVWRLRNGNWSEVTGNLKHELYDLEVFDDGGGPALYAAGGRWDYGTSTWESGLLRWNQPGWSVVARASGAGVPIVTRLEVFDGGGAPRLIAGGGFDAIEGVAANNVAAWDGVSWSALGPGLNGPVSGAPSGGLFAHDDGGGSQLYVSGAFTTAGGVATGELARWDGQGWSSVGGPWSGSAILEFATHDDGGGELLFGVTQAGGLMSWDGSAWQAVLTGNSQGPNGGLELRALASHDDGSGSRLYVAGDFEFLGSVYARHVAASSAGGWEPVGPGEPVQDSVHALLDFDDGSEPLLVAGGAFRAAGKVAADRVAAWDGQAWRSLGAGLSDDVLALAQADLGSGIELYAGGRFTNTGGAPVQHVARWDGQVWQPLGSGVQGNAWAMLAHDDGSGPALFVGGGFTVAGGLPARRLARWDGSAWTEVGGGLDGAVRAMAELGGELYVGGGFTQAGGQPCAGVARWDGLDFHPLGPGLSGTVHALEGYHDGKGWVLAAGGSFLQAGGTTVNRVAGWDGSAWAPYGGGLGGSVRTLVARYDTEGAELWAAGDAGTILGRWDGAAWVTPASNPTWTVRALAAFDDGSGPGPALFAGGDFDGIYGGWGSWETPHLARMDDPCAFAGTAYCTAGTSGSGCQALLSSSGQPSASAPSGFVLTANQAEGSKTGLFLWSSLGRQANPWGNGTSYVCVVPPRYRSQVVASGGTGGACDGSFSVDLNARWSAKPNQNPGPGALTQAQLWYRDPLSTSNQATSLSDAMEFFVAP